MNFIVRYYNKNDKLISSHIIYNRTDNEAEKEAIADMPSNCEDWSLMPYLYELKENQYLPDGFGKPCKTYYYFVNEAGKVVNKDTLKPYRGKQMNFYAIKDKNEAIKRLKEINQ